LLVVTDSQVDRWTDKAALCPSVLPMTEADIDSAVDLVRSAMNTAEAEQARTTFILHFGCARHGIDDGRIYFVAAVESVTLGVVGLHRYVWGPPENIWLAWFAVDPNLKGLGFGQTLFQFASERAQQLGHRKLFVETYSTPEFAAARSFYQKMGMVPGGIITPYLPCGGNMIVYYKELTKM